MFCAHKNVYVCVCLDVCLYLCFMGVLVCVSICQVVFKCL